MSVIAWLLGVLSGLHFVAPDLPPAVVIVTTIAMHITYAVLCRIFAVQNGRNGRTWMIAGMLGGAIPTILLLVLNEIEAARAARESTP